MRCTFKVHGARRTIALHWRPIDRSDMFSRLASSRAPPPPPTEMHSLADGIRWLTLPSFDGNPASDAAKGLTAILKTLDDDGVALRAAPAIVLDLRGNTGGSSDWPWQIAKRLWGEGAPDALAPDKATVTWRVSPANLETIRASYQKRLKTGEMSNEERQWFEQVIGGLQGANAAHKEIWTQGPDASPAASKANLPRYKLHGRVYFITDSACALACLDAVNLRRSLGAIHDGQETSADTLYLEVRSDDLPSKLGRISVPMKVYRDRKRGSNQSVVPQHIFKGDINVTAELQAWIKSLP